MTVSATVIESETAGAGVSSAGLMAAAMMTQSVMASRLLSELRVTVPAEVTAS